jgi:hypothetical protein
MIHCVTPTGSGDKAEVSAPKRCNPAPGLHLAEPAIVGRNDDVSREHHFDADRKYNSCNGGDDWLPTLVCQAEGIDIPFRSWLACCGRPKKLRHVQARSEVVAVGTEDANPKVFFFIQQSEGVRQLLHHLWTEGILFCRIIDYDLQNMVVALVIDATFGAGA